jgi:hypothetical protein
MEYTILDNGWYQIKFEVPHEQYGTYCDALVLSPSDYAALTENQIEAMKQERFDNWLTSFQATLTESEQEKILSLVAQFDLSDTEQYRLFLRSLKGEVL